MFKRKVNRYIPLSLLKISRWILPIKNGLILLLLPFVFWPAGAQLITHKSGLFELRDSNSGEPLFEQKFDTIYQLALRPRNGYQRSDEHHLPIFACIKHQKIQLFNGNSNQFLPGKFDEIKLYRQIDEQSLGINPPAYTPYCVDCFMLRTGNRWGYISYKKEYSFHDRLEKTDVFQIVEPQFDELKFVEEEFGYDSQKYKRKKRIVAARKDSLWGALSFETCVEVVPFQYQLPIFSAYTSYNNRGLEFLSTTGGFIPYYLARKTWDTTPQLVINPQHPDIWFAFDFIPIIHIYQEFSNQYLYVEPKKDQHGFFYLYEYNTGKLLLKIPRDLKYQNFTTHRSIENVLIIEEYTLYENLFRTSWYNLTTGDTMLKAEGKSYKRIHYNIKKAEEILVLKGEKPVGKIVGTGSEMSIQWTSKKMKKRDLLD